MSPLDCVGSVVVEYKYDAWGNHEAEVAEEEYAVLAEKNPFRYRGYYYDTETDLYYLQTRYYDPEVGRFISRDSIEYAAPESINGLNLYAYCFNNPVMYTDETGCSILLTLLFGFLIGFVISGVVEIGKQVQTYGWDVFQWDWKQIGLSALGGGVSGLISAIPLGGFVGAFFFGGVGAVVGGFISGSVTDIESGIKAFVIGGVANLIGYGVAKGIENLKVNNIMKLSSKAKSANIWKLKGVDPSSLLKKTRYIFKDYTRKQVAEVVRETNKWLQYNIQSSFVSSSLSSLGGLI